MFQTRLRAYVFLGRSWCSLSLWLMVLCSWYYIKRLSCQVLRIPLFCQCRVDYVYYSGQVIQFMRHDLLVYFKKLILDFACVKVGQSRVRSRFQYGLLQRGHRLGWFGVLVYQVEPQRLQVAFMVCFLVGGFRCRGAAPGVCYRVKYYQAGLAT